MTSEPTVVARIRGTSERPQFSQPRPISELIELLYKQLSVDKVYFVDTVKGINGSYTQQLTEAGSFIIQFLPFGEDIIPPVATKPEVAKPPVAIAPFAPSDERIASIDEDNDQAIEVATPTRNNRNLTPSRSSNRKIRRKIKKPKTVIATKPKAVIAPKPEFAFSEVSGPLNQHTKHKTQRQLLAEKGIIETTKRPTKPTTLKGPMFE